MLLTEHHEVVNTLAADRADQTFGKAVLPWRAGCDRLVADSHRPQPAPDNGPIDSVAIPDQVRGASFQGKASVICRAIHSAVGWTVTLTQTSSRRASRTMIKALPPTTRQTGEAFGLPRHGDRRWAINPSFHLGRGAGAKSAPQTGVPVGNSNPPILMVQSAQNGRDTDMAAAWTARGIGASLHRDR